MPSAKWNSVDFISTEKHMRQPGLLDRIKAVFMPSSQQPIVVQPSKSPYINRPTTSHFTSGPAQTITQVERSDRTGRSNFNPDPKFMMYAGDFGSYADVTDVYAIEQFKCRTDYERLMAMQHKKDQLMLESSASLGESYDAGLRHMRDTNNTRNPRDKILKMQKSHRHMQHACANTRE